MKLYLAVLVFIAFFSSAFSQTIPQNPNRTDLNGLRQGKWTLLFDANWVPVVEYKKAVFYRLINYKNDKPVGIVKDYYPSGKIQWQGTLLTDRPQEINNGLSTWFRENGTKEIDRMFVNGKIVKEKYYDLKGNLLPEWKVFRDKGTSAYENEQYDTAIYFFNKCLELAKGAFGTYHTEYAAILVSKSMAYRKLGNYPIAKTLVKGGLVILDSLNGMENSEYASALSTLALIHTAESEYDSALPMDIQIVKTFEKIAGKQNLDYIVSLNNLAQLYMYQGKYAIAESLFSEVITLQESLDKDHAAFSTFLNNFAEMYKTKGEYNKAEPLLLRSLMVSEKTAGKSSIDYALSLGNLAALYSLQGNYKKAIRSYKEVLSILQPILGKDHYYCGTLLHNLAQSYHMLGDDQTAEILLQDALAITAKAFGTDNLDYAKSLAALASVYRDNYKFMKAEKVYLEALAMEKRILGEDHPDLANLLNNLAVLYNKMGEPASAKELSKQAVTIVRALNVNSPDLVYALTSLGLSDYNLHDYKEAEISYSEAIEHQLDQIKNYFPALSEREKEFFYGTVKTDFERFSSFAIQARFQNPSILSKVYNNQLATKALLFNANKKIKYVILQSKDSSLIQNYNQWLSKRRALATAYQLTEEQKEKGNVKIPQLEDDLNLLEKELSLRSESFANENQNKQCIWQDVQKSLKKGEAAIEFIRLRKYGFRETAIDSSDARMPHYPQYGLTDTIYYVALIVTPQSKLPELVLLTNGVDMEGKFIKGYKNNLQFKTEDRISYAQYWQPIASFLKKKGGIKKVYLSPDGVYNSINLNTLQNPVTNKYVAEELDIQLVTNTKDLIILKSKAGKKISTNASLFGYPDYAEQDTSRQFLGQERGIETMNQAADSIQRFFAGGKISKLPGTQREILAIGKLLSANQIKTEQFSERLATEVEIKSIHDLSILHIATHGFFLQDVEVTSEQTFAGFDFRKLIENPLLRSGLLLAGSQKTIDGQRGSDGEDGILTAYEAMNLNLDETELVVLSACETGLGEIRNGEGVYGLQRAFQTAGAKSILMSLWKVDDNATQELMTSFYKNWLASGDKREAFKRAQVSVRKKYEHPYYWGAFVLVGE